MGLLIIVPFLALAGRAIFLLRRWLWREEFEARWRSNFWRGAGVGLVLGGWLAFYPHYSVANVRVRGFPFPIQIETRQNPSSPYESGALPVVVQIGSVITDMAIAVLLCVALVAVAAFFKTNRNPQPGVGPDS